jgi:hypothetical protein
MVRYRGLDKHAHRLRAGQPVHGPPPSAAPTGVVRPDLVSRPPPTEIGHRADRKPPSDHSASTAMTAFKPNVPCSDVP